MSPWIFLMSILLLVVVSHGDDGFSPWRKITTPPPMYTAAPPGGTPACAKDGETFCTEIDSYPKDLIAEFLKNNPTVDPAWYIDVEEGPQEPAVMLDRIPDFILPPGYTIPADYDD